MEASPTDPPITFGPYRLDRANARLLCDGRPLALTPKSFDVLHYLASRPDQLVTKQELLEAVWPDVIVGDASVKVAVREIRHVLEDPAKAPRFVETVFRRGYRFISATGDGAPPLPAPMSFERPESVFAPPFVDEGTDVTVATDSALVGRDTELEHFAKCHQRAASGKRQCLFITGGAGSGKTSLIEKFITEQRREEMKENNGPDVHGSRTKTIVLAGHCFQQFGGSEPYLPVWEALGRLPADRVTPQILTLHGRHAAAYELSTSAPSGSSPAATSTAAREPRRMSERLLREMADAIESIARATDAVGSAAPLVFVLEDLQWADYSTLDLVSALSRRRGPARLMIIATYRPNDVLDSENPLQSVAQDLRAAGLCEEIALDALDESAVAQYLSSRCPGDGISAKFSRRLHQRSKGHPLFLVHLVNSLIEQGVLEPSIGTGWQVAGERDCGSATEDPAWVAVLETQVPETVRLMIESQLARLDPAVRRVIEAASVVGVEFSVAAASAASGAAGSASGDASNQNDTIKVEQLCDLLARRYRFLEARGLSEWPDGTLSTQYRFAHELYHDVVYSQIPAARLAAMHRAVGLRIEAAWASRAPEEAATLAMHFESGRDWPQAVGYLRNAATAAGRQHAHREAIHYLRRALAAVKRLPANTRAANELPILMALGVNLQVTRGFAAAEVREVHDRAQLLCQTRIAVNTVDGEPDRRMTFLVLWGVWLFRKVRSDLRQADEMAHRLVTLAVESGDDALMLQAHQAMCVTNLCLGNPKLTCEHMELAAAIYDPARHAGNAEVFGQDPGVASLAFGSVALWQTGHRDEAAGGSKRSRDLARQLNQPSSLALALHFSAMLHQLRGEPADTRTFAREVIDLAAEEGFSFWLAGGTILHGWASATLGDPEGIADIQRGINAWLATGSRTYHTYFLGLLADALLRHGRTDEARPILDEALAAATELPEGIFQAELIRLKEVAINR